MMPNGFSTARVPLLLAARFVVEGGVLRVFGRDSAPSLRFTHDTP